MATVLYTKMWLTNLATTEQLSAQSGDDRRRSYSTPGDRRIYGSGRIRAVRQAGVLGTWAFELQELTLAQCNTLLVWLGTGATVFARDHRGQAGYGTFFGVDTSENKAQTPTGATYKAAVVLSLVDVVEGV